jgi:hypothetical protein
MWIAPGELQVLRTLVVNMWALLFVAAVPGCREGMESLGVMKRLLLSIDERSKTARMSGEMIAV